MSRIDQIRQFLQESPEDAFLNYALAQEFISAGNDADAEILFQKLLSLHPDYTATYYHYGKLLERKQQTETATKIYKQGIEIAKQKREQHALSELQSALLELEYGDM